MVNSEKKVGKFNQFAEDDERKVPNRRLEGEFDTKEVISRKQEQSRFEQLENKMKSYPRNEEGHLRTLQSEKRNIEEKYTKAILEMGKMQEHNRELEHSHKQEINFLKEKVKRLSHKVQSFEQPPEPQKNSAIPAVFQTIFLCLI